MLKGRFKFFSHLTFMASVGLILSSCSTNHRQYNKDGQISTIKKSAENDAKAANLEKSGALETKAFGQDLSLDFKEYFDFLNLDYKGLEKVKQPREAKQWGLAAEELLTYYRQRYSGVSLSRLREADKRTADLALKHYFKGNKGYPELYRGEEIDWLSKGTFEGKTVHDAEYLFQFHRLNWWPALAKTYRESGDERYYLEWELELKSYLKTIFPISKKSPWFLRRGMECESRNRNLMRALPYLIHSEKFTAETMLEVLYMLHHQTEQIRKVYAKKGNHLLADLDGVLSTAAEFPEFKQSNEWLDEVLEKYPNLMFSEIFEDGMNKELIFSYHTMYISLFTKFYKKLEKFGLGNRLPEEFHQRLEKMHEVFAYHAYPDMSYCQFGDAWKRGAGSVRRMVDKHSLKEYPNNHFYQYLVSQGKKGVAPEKTSRAFPVSGFYFFRSDWSDQAVFMPVKSNSTKGEWHNHIDNGTFGLYAYGRNFMNDSGSYKYGSDDPEEKRWREWFKSTKVHQTLTLDEQNIQLDSKCLHWSDEQDLSVLVIENKSYENLRHRRSILFINKKYFIIHDQAIGEAEGEVKIHFQLVPSEVEIDESQALVRTAFSTGANLTVQSHALQGITQLEKEEGWISYEYGKKQERPAWCLKQNKKADQDLDFVTTLEPLREDQKSVNPKVSVVPFDGGINYLIESSSGKRQITVKYNAQ